ncbi:MAG: hypothetical protein HOP19_12655, partial [Acidobacteria bacterium]|nr:hypothetical protein [Acidobacteriota bacterium]
MRVIRYNLELIQPVLIPDPQGEANSAISLPYLPGSLLRGGLIGLYRQAFDATDADIRALFLGDATRYLNAYPVKDGQRALPVSAAWRYDKRAKVEGDKAQRTIYNFAHTLQELQEESIDANFIWLKEEGSQGERFSPPRQVNVHTLRNARKGRAVPRDRKTGKYDTDAGTVYRYDALVAGLMLQGMILTEADEQLADKLITLLQQHETLWIGRARRAGYGEVRITVVEDDGRRENGGYNRPEAPQGLQLMLTSDALLRDEWGQTTLDPSVAVAELLGLPHTTFKLKADSAFLTARVVGGFNRKWGLLLPRTLALAAGSTFDLESAEPLSTEQLEQLEQHGIGERRNEGFGQLLVRADERAEIHSERWEPQFSPVQLNLSESEKKLAQTLAERLLRRKLEDELRQLVNRIE